MDPETYHSIFAINLLTFVSSDLSFYIIGLLVSLTMLMLSAIVSAAEIAFFSVKEQDIILLRNSNRLVDIKITKLLEDPKLLLACMLIAFNVLDIAFVTITSSLGFRYFGGEGVNLRILLTALTVVISFCIVVAGELVPKIYASQNCVKVARKTIWFVSVFEFILKPFGSILTSFSSLIEKRIKHKGYKLSVEELNQALELTTGQETSEEEKEILKGIVNFGSISARQIMRSRQDIVAVNIDDDFHELMNKINKNGYSRMPVYVESIDKIEGILYVKDFLPHLDKDENFDWKTLIRENYFIPENKKIDVLLKDFQKMRMHLAIIVDEYGGTVGLITLEDIIEQIVGDIRDEFDDPYEKELYTKNQDGSLLVEAKMQITALSEVLEQSSSYFDQDRGESESVGGMILEINSKLPNTGEFFEIKDYAFEVLAVDNRKIKKVKIKLINNLN